MQLQDNNTIGGWAERLESNVIVDEDEDNVILKGIELITENVTRSSSRRNFHEIRDDIIKKAIDNLERRFLPDEQLIEIVRPFIEFEEDANIQQIHTIFGANLQLATLDLEFKELVHLKLCSGLNLTNQIKKLIEPFQNMTLCLLFFVASTPSRHSLQM